MKNSQHARNLLSTTTASDTGAVRSTSSVPVRRSSLNSRMVSAGTRNGIISGPISEPAK